jgi:hypothetical protein
VVLILAPIDQSYRSLVGITGCFFKFGPTVSAIRLGNGVSGLFIPSSSEKPSWRMSSACQAGFNLLLGPSAIAVQCPAFNGPIGQARVRFCCCCNQRSETRTRARWNRDCIATSRGYCTRLNFARNPLKRRSAWTKIDRIRGQAALICIFAYRSTNPCVQGRLHWVAFGGARTDDKGGK